MHENTSSGPQDDSLPLSVISPTADGSAVGPQTDAVAHLANERTFLAWGFSLIQLRSLVFVDGSGLIVFRQRLDRRCKKGWQ